MACLKLIYKTHKAFKNQNFNRLITITTNATSFTFFDTHWN